MSAYGYEAKEDQDVAFRGDQVHLNAGERWWTDSACEMLEFIGGAPGAVNERAITVQQLRDACGVEAEGSGQPGPPRDPPAGQPENGTSVTDTSADTPPVEPDDGDQQGAPNVDAAGNVDGQTLGGRDQTPPEEEPREAPAGEEHPERSGEESDQRNEAGEPVELFSGFYTFRTIDIEVPTAMLPLQLVRTYRSGGPSFGPFGFNWDHNYNVFLRILANGDVVRWTGNAHEDRFVLRGDGGFDPPRGVFERLERLPGPADRFQLGLAGGEVHRFERPAGWVDPERIPLVSIADRHENQQAVAYGADDRLQSVTDGDGRALQFAYDDRGLVHAVSDQAGRTIRYCYHPEIEHLACVTMAATTDFPDGEATSYEYDYPKPYPELRHNIIRVADHHGGVQLVNEYEQDPTAWGYNRVVRQDFCGDVFEYEYSSIQYVRPADEFVNLPFSRTEVRYPDQSLRTFTFNFRGDLLDRRLRLVRDGSFRVAFEQTAYDEQGNETTVVAADGGRTELIYDAANPDPCARGNLLQVELRPAAGFPAPSRFLWRATYEGTYQLLRESIVEGGHRTRYEYDFDVAPGQGATGKLVRIRYPGATLPDGTVQAAARRFEHNARGQVTAEITPLGTRSELRYVAAGADRGRLESVTHDAAGTPSVERLEYDGFGFVQAAVDPTGAVTRFVRNTRGQLELHERPAVGGSTAQTRFAYGIGDRLKRVERSAGEYDDGVVGLGGAIEDLLTYDGRGRLVELVLGANTARPRPFRMCHDYAGRLLCVHDPAGVNMQRRYDERGLLLEETPRSDTLAGPTVRWSYDRVGRMTGTIFADGQRTQQTYDGFGRAARMVRPDGTEQRLAYAEGDIVASREVRGDPGNGVVRLLSKVRHEYDERARERRRFLTSFAEDPTTAVELETAFVHDEDDHVVFVQDHRGAVSEAAFDGDRLVRQIDPLGNSVEWEYDAAMRETARTLVGNEGGGVRSRRTQFRYDARGRLVERIEPDGATMSYRYDDRDLLVELIGPSGVAERHTYGLLAELLQRIVDPGGLALTDERTYDVMGRVETYVDPLGEASTVVRDALGRQVRTVFADGSTFSRAYGADGRVASETSALGTTVSYDYDPAGRLAKVSVAAAVGADPVPDHRFAYDGLSRLVEGRADARTVQRRYDSLDRLLREISDGATIEERYDDAAGTVERELPDGRRERVSLDLLGRVQSVVETAPGTLGGLDPNLLAMGYAGLDRWEKVSLPGGVETTATYDERHRLTSIAWDAGGNPLESARYRYDAASRRRLEILAGAPQLRRRVDVDDGDRLIRVDEGFPPAALGPGETQAEHDADIAAAFGAGPAPASVAYTLSAADDRLAETVSGAAPVLYTYAAGHQLRSVGGVPVTHHPDGHRATDATRSYEVDALGRLVRVRDSGGTMLTEVGYDPLGRLAELTENGTPRAFHYFGGVLLQEDRGGSPFRQWTEHPTLGQPLLVHRVGALESRATGATLELLALLDHSGVAIARYRYGPFGEPRVFDSAGNPVALGSAVEAPHFGGMSYLETAELYWTTHRAMDPSTGLFLARDPHPFLDSPSPYVYAAHAPLDLVDPEGDLAFLVVLGIIAIGAAIGGGASAARQGIGIWSGERTEPFSWGEVGWGALMGGALAPVIVFAPEVAIPLAGLGLASAANEARQGHWATAGFDAVLALAPFKSATVRSATFGRGSVIGQFRGIAPAESLAGRWARFDLPSGVRPPGVRVVRTEFEGIPAWEKSVYARWPFLRWWAEQTVRAQVRGLRRLEANGVPSARILQEYQPGGSLVIEDVGALASEALRANPQLQAAYNAYYAEAARALGWPRLGRIPGIRQFLHDLRPDNIGYTSGRGFRAFDPSLDPISVPVAAAIVAEAFAIAAALQGRGRRDRPQQPVERGDEGGPAAPSADAGGGKP